MSKSICAAAGRPASRHPTKITIPTGHRAFMISLPRASVGADRDDAAVFARTQKTVPMFSTLPDSGYTPRMQQRFRWAVLVSAGLVIQAAGVARADAGPRLHAPGHRERARGCTRGNARSATARTATWSRASTCDEDSSASPCPTTTCDRRSRPAFPARRCRRSNCSQPNSTGSSRSSAPASTSAAWRSRSAMPDAGRRCSMAKGHAAPVTGSTARARAWRRI